MRQDGLVWRAGATFGMQMPPLMQTLGKKNGSHLR